MAKEVGASGGVGLISRDQIGVTLRSLRQDATLSQRALAQRLGRSHRWIQLRESGQSRIDVTHFVAWCLACGAKPDPVLQKIMHGGRKRNAAR